MRKLCGAERLCAQCLFVTLQFSKFLCLCLRCTLTCLHGSL